MLKLYVIDTFVEMEEDSLIKKIISRILEMFQWYNNNNTEQILVSVQKGNYFQEYKVVLFLHIPSYIKVYSQPIPATSCVMFPSIV